MSQHAADLLAHVHENGIDVRKRRVFLADLDGPRADQATRNLLWLDSHGQGPIEIWLINCPGGVIDSMWALYDAIRGCSAPVSTIALGCNASAACLILAAGDKGLRFAATHASFMWHGGETTIEDVGPGTLRDAAAWMARESAHWCEAMARTTHPPGARTLAERAAFWEASLHDRQLWLDAKGMVRHGVVDKILPETE